MFLLSPEKPMQSSLHLDSFDLKRWQANCAASLSTAAWMVLGLPGEQFLRSYCRPRKGIHSGDLDIIDHYSDQPGSQFGSLGRSSLYLPPLRKEILRKFDPLLSVRKSDILLKFKESKELIQSKLPRIRPAIYTALLDCVAVVNRWPAAGYLDTAKALRLSLLVPGQLQSFLRSRTYLLQNLMAIRATKDKYNAEQKKQGRGF